MSDVRHTLLSDEELRVWHGFLRAHREITEELGRRLERAHALNLVGYDVLRTLLADANRQMRMTVLAERVQTSPSGMTRAVGRLGRAGLVSRSQDPDDRRSFVVRLTPSGEATARASQVTHHACVRELLVGGLTSADLARLRTIYDRAPAGTVTSVWLAAS